MGTRVATIRHNSATADADRRRHYHIAWARLARRAGWLQDDISRCHSQMAIREQVAHAKRREAAIFSRVSMIADTDITSAATCWPRVTRAEHMRTKASAARPARQVAHFELTSRPHHHRLTLALLAINAYGAQALPPRVFDI